MTEPRRVTLNPDEPLRLVGSRCPNRSCRFKLIRKGKNGEPRLVRGIRVVDDDIWYRGPRIKHELDVLNRQADEAERQWGKDSAEYRKTAALINEKWRESVKAKMGHIVLECPKCGTQMDASNLDLELGERALELVERARTDANFRSANIPGGSRVLPALFALTDERPSKR